MKLQPVLWIRNDLVRLRSSRIRVRILTFEPDQATGLLQDFISILIFPREICMKLKTNWTVLKANLRKKQKDFLVKRSDPDPNWPKSYGSFRFRIHSTEYATKQLFVKRSLCTKNVPAVRREGGN